MKLIVKAISCIALLMLTSGIYIATASASLLDYPTIANYCTTMSVETKTFVTTCQDGYQDLHRKVEQIMPKVHNLLIKKFPLASERVAFAQNFSTRLQQNATLTSMTKKRFLYELLALSLLQHYTDDYYAIDASRQWALYSNKYTITSSNENGTWLYDALLPYALVHTVTQNDHLGSAAIIQTDLPPRQMLDQIDYRGMIPQEEASRSRPVQFFDINTTDTSQGYTRKLFDGPVDSQFRVTQIGDTYLYFADHFANRGCMVDRGEICMDAFDVLDSIGEKK